MFVFYLALSFGTVHKIQLIVGPVQNNNQYQANNYLIFNS